MSFNNYLDNPEENIILAMFEEDLKDHNGNAFTVHGSAPVFKEDAVVGKYIEVPEKSYISIKNDGLAVGTGDFTLDFWAYSIGRHCAVSTVCGANGVAIFSYNDYARQKANIGYYNQGENISLPDYKSKEWAHYAFVRKNGMCYAFVNGVLQGKVNSSRDITSKTMVVNNDHADNNLGDFYDLSNYYKAVRFCAFARWTEDFEVKVPKVEKIKIVEKYQDNKGKELKVDVINYLGKGEDYLATAPVIEGYKAIGYKINGGALVSGDAVTITDVTAEHIIVFVYEVAVGDGESGGKGKCIRICLPAYICDCDCDCVEITNKCCK